MTSISRKMAGIFKWTQVSRDCGRPSQYNSMKLHAECCPLCENKTIRELAPLLVSRDRLPSCCRVNTRSFALLGLVVNRVVQYLKGPRVHSQTLPLILKLNKICHFSNSLKKAGTEATPVSFCASSIFQTRTVSKETLIFLIWNLRGYLDALTKT
jgi:hypothetical protein